jgi:PDZ domain
MVRSRPDRSRLVLFATLLVLIAALGVGLLDWSSGPFDGEPDDFPSLPTRVATVRGFATLEERTPRERQRPNRERRPERPRQLPAEEAAVGKERALAGDRHSAATEPTTASGRPATEQHTAAADSSGGAIERILGEEGLSPAVVEDLQRRFEHTLLAAADVRNVAAREGWLDSPRFSDEMAAIEAERRAIRDEIGDEAYDLFLFATGELNRAVVADVERQSRADAAGLQAGDIIVSYDRVRIFSPNDLLAEIDAGKPGTIARLGVHRSGRPIRIDVPAGPLGASIGATQEVPERMRRR